jgi:predicted dehydrogenase
MKPASHLSRRRFLSRAALAAGLTPFMPDIIPSRVLAAPGQPGANDRIGVGTIGVGRQAGGLLQMMVRMPDVRYVAVADVNLPRAEASAAAHGAKAYEDYRKLLENRDVDAIITATPEHWRILICLHACQAGKDLYVEKPISLTIREGRLIVDAVKKYQRVFQTGSQQRSMWPNYAACDFLRNGGLGRIRRVIAHNYPSPWHHDLPAEPVPKGLNWDLWCGPTRLVPFNRQLYVPRGNPGWLSFRPYSGGEMTGWGSHGFDQVQWALGQDTAGPVEVWTEGEKFDPPTYTEVESKARGDAICSKPKVFFRYPGDIVMELGEGGPGGAIFIGDKGRVTLDRAFFRSDPAELAEEAMQQPRPPGFEPNHLRNWFDCIKTRRQPIADAETGHRSATVCHLGNIARETGRRLQWDPVKEQFTNDREANQLLDRERRQGYEVPQRI